MKTTTQSRNHSKGHGKSKNYEKIQRDKSFLDYYFKERKYHVLSN